ncbi:MAG: glycosyltransferase [Planctomycetales bacterium]|nr:glycosyltransferase [Planctomycetales bacterium]
MLELGRELKESYRSVFISFLEEGRCWDFIEKARADGFQAHALQYDTPRLLAAVKELTALLRSVNAKLLFCHGYKPNLLGLLAARKLGIPAVAVSRGWTGESLRVRLFDALDRRVLRWMDKVVCVSEGQAAKVRRAGVREDKITVIRNAIRPERFADPDPAYREQLRRMFLDPGKGDRSILCAAPGGPFRQNGPVPFSGSVSGPDFIVGAAGRLSPEKGFGVLVDAAAIVLGSGVRGQGSGINVGFVLFGDGPLRESLERQIAARGLEGKFILAGFRSDLDQFLPHLDLMVLPSFSEGLPNVALESLAAGVPVVATAVGGTPEVIEDGRTGYLVPPGDPAALADRIISTLSDRTLRSNFAAAGRDRVARRFSFAAQAEAYRNLLASVTSSKAQTIPKPANTANVCFVIDNLSVAGTESQLLALIRGLDRAKVQPHLCLLDGRSDRSRSLEPADCPVLRLGARSLRRPSTLARAWRFARFLRRNRIDVVHCFFPDSTRFAVPVACLAGVRRIVASRRNLGHWMTSWDRRLARLYRRWIDVTVANCEACRRAVIEQEGIAPDRVVVIPNGIDLDRFAGIPAYAPSDNGRPEKGSGPFCAQHPEGHSGKMDLTPFPALVRRVGMVANLRPVKAPDVFVRAAAIVAQSHPDVIFQIAGSGDTESVRRLARECGVENRLELLGQVQDVPSFLAGLDVAVLTSHSEGLSNSLLEYMAAGRPIVATAVGGNCELIQHEMDGLLVSSSEPQGIAEAIKRLLLDTKLAANLGTATLSVARERYSLEAMLRQHGNFYRGIISQNQ